MLLGNIFIIYLTILSVLCLLLLCHHNFVESAGDSTDAGKQLAEAEGSGQGGYGQDEQPQSEAEQQDWEYDGLLGSVVMGRRHRQFPKSLHDAAGPSAGPSLAQQTVEAARPTGMALESRLEEINEGGWQEQQTPEQQGNQQHMIGKSGDILAFPLDNDGRRHWMLQPPAAQSRQMPREMPQQLPRQPSQNIPRKTPRQLPRSPLGIQQHLPEQSEVLPPQVQAPQFQIHPQIQISPEFHPSSQQQQQPFHFQSNIHPDPWQQPLPLPWINQEENPGRYPHHPHQLKSSLQLTNDTFQNLIDFARNSALKRKDKNSASIDVKNASSKGKRKVNEIGTSPSSDDVPTGKKRNKLLHDAMTSGHSFFSPQHLQHFPASESSSHLAAPLSFQQQRPKTMELFPHHQHQGSKSSAGAQDQDVVDNFMSLDNWQQDMPSTERNFNQQQQHHHLIRNPGPIADEDVNNLLNFHYGQEQNVQPVEPVIEPSQSAVNPPSLIAGQGPAAVIEEIQFQPESRHPQRNRRPPKRFSP